MSRSGGERRIEGGESGREKKSGRERVGRESRMEGGRRTCYF